MDKKRYIKALEAIPGNPQIVINVLTNDGISKINESAEALVKSTREKE